MKKWLLGSMVMAMCEAQAIEIAPMQEAAITTFVPFSVEKPLSEGYLQVSEKHSLYYATYGNPQGIPVVVLHGGPGVGCGDHYTRFFDLNRWRVVMLDQRGVMRSKPFACMEENTTQELIHDIEKLKEHLNITQWVVFGHSWGSCLGLLYAEEFPKSCLGFILEGIFLGREQDIGFFRNLGKRSLSAYEELLRHFSEEEQKDIQQACYQKIMDPDPVIHNAMARALLRYQMLNALHPPSPEIVEQVLSDERFALSFVRAFVYYAVHSCFLRPNQVLEEIKSIADLPAIIVQGSEDLVCPLSQASALHALLKNSQLWVIEGAGHSIKEPLIAEGLMKATERWR